ncbi:MAG TPA: hypothetical protein VGG34_05080 [Opitutaceae bacterium]
MRIVTEQPDFAGEAPIPDEMDRLLRSEYFMRLDIPPMGNYKSLSYIRGDLGLFDVHPANCVVNADGEPISIDFILRELADKDRATLVSRIV